MNIVFILNNLLQVKIRHFTNVQNGNKWYYIDKHNVHSIIECSICKINNKT